MSSLIKVGNFSIEDENYGKPRCPHIILDPPHSSLSLPQAWQLVIRGKKEWFYNFLGALEEEKHRQSLGENRRIFTENEGRAILSESAPGGDPVAKSIALNFTYNGYRHQSDIWEAQDVLACLWTSTKSSTRPEEARTVWLGHGIGADLTGGGYQAQGKQIRFIVDRILSHNSPLEDILEDLEFSQKRGFIDLNTYMACQKHIQSGDYQSAYRVLAGICMGIREICLDDLSEDEKKLVNTGMNGADFDFETSPSDILKEGLQWAIQQNDDTIDAFSKIRGLTPQQIECISFLGDLMTKVGYLSLPIRSK